MHWVHALSCGNALSSLRSGNTFYGPLLDQDYICWYLVEQLQDFQVNLDTYCYYFLAIYLLVNRFNLLVQRESKCESWVNSKYWRWQAV